MGGTAQTVRELRRAGGRNKMQYNDIGIDSTVDWARIRKLLTIGLIAGCMIFAGDMILGYGVYDDNLTGLEKTLSAKITKTDAQLFWAAFLGFIGIPLAGLGYFGIYRLIAEQSLKHTVIRKGLEITWLYLIDKSGEKEIYSN